MVRRNKRKRLVRERAAEPRLVRANQEWAMDFITDGLATGRMVRILSVVDAYTRECLVLGSRHKPGQRTCDPRARAADHGTRQAGDVRSDNGPEFTSRRMLGWAEDWKIGLVHIQPGQPMQKRNMWKASTADCVMSAFSSMFQRGSPSYRHSISGTTCT